MAEEPHADAGIGPNRQLLEQRVQRALSQFQPRQPVGIDEFNRKVAELTEGAYKGPMAKLGAGPEAVAKTIDRALSSKRPKPRYPVTASARTRPDLS